MVKNPEKVLKGIEKQLKGKLRKQSVDALASVYNQMGCKAVSKEIKAERNVTGNAEFDIKICVHNKIGPRFNPTTDTFYPMTARNKVLEKKFVHGVNELLGTGGFKKMNPGLISSLRKKDRKFQLDVKKRRK